MPMVSSTQSIYQIEISALTNMLQVAITIRMSDEGLKLSGPLGIFNQFLEPLHVLAG
jgi:hypothetical protein